MRTFIARASLHIRESGISVWRNIADPKNRGWIILASALLLIALPTAALAGPKEWAMEAIAWVLGAFVNLLGILITYVTRMLITFASYNSFKDAIPVSVGWVIVRDIVNMFFIVILIVSAFATVIGKPEDFHYKKVLPKLLFMAVFVNFSKTLILLAIDFSQVVMLTFVNAFKEMTAGSMTEALKLNKIVEIATKQSETQALQQVKTTRADGTDLIDLVAAYMLAVFLCVIALGTILILTLYILFRIIGLWMAIIFSPIAFVLGALPESIKKSLSSLSSDYWGKLNAFLFGGPLVAFFLWLTFATIQSSIGSGGASASLQLYDAKLSEGEVPFINRIGTTQDIASFIIAIAMMLMGLQAAVDWSKKASDKLGKMAENISAGSKSVGKKLALFAGGGLGTLGGGLVARNLERKYDVRGKLAQFGRKIPLADTIYGGASEMLTGKKHSLKEIQMMNRERMAKERAEKDKFRKGLTTSERAYEDSNILGRGKSLKRSVLDRLAGAAPTSIPGRIATKMAQAVAITPDYAAEQVSNRKLDASDETRKTLMKLKKGEYEKTYGKMGYGKAEASAMAEQQAQREIDEFQRSALMEGAALSGEMLTRDDRARESDAVSEMQKKALLFKDQAALDDHVKTLGDEDLQKLAKEQSGRGDVLMAIMKAKKVVVTDPSGEQVIGFNENNFHDLASLVEKNKALHAGLQGARAFIQGSQVTRPGGTKDYDGLRVEAFANKAFKDVKGPGQASFNATGEKPEQLQSSLLNAMATDNGSLSSGEKAARGRMEGTDFMDPLEIRNAATAVGMSIKAIGDLASEAEDTGRVLDAKEHLSASIGMQLGTEITRISSDPDVRTHVTEQGRLVAEGRGIADLSLEQRIDILSRIEDDTHAAGVNAAETMAEAYDQMSRAQRQFVETVAGEAAKIANGAAQKRKRGDMVLPAEEAVERLFAKLQAAFPKEKRTVSTPGAGGSTTTVEYSAPEPIVRKLHPEARS